jgi:hypothetical protein
LAPLGKHEAVRPAQAKPGLLKVIGWEREVPAWHARLTRAFSNDTHLVGPAISCEGMHERGDPDAEWRANPHVLSHAIAIDQVRAGAARHAHQQPPHACVHALMHAHPQQHLCACR